MINILLKTDTFGTILDVLWCDPAYLMFVTDSPINAYFHPKNRGEIEKNIRLTSTSNTHTPPIQVSTKDGTLLRLVMTKVEEDIFVFGYHGDASMSVEENEFLKIVHRFLDTLKLNEQKVDYYGIEAQTLNFEKIQMLNNDLINMQRKLEKVNAQLNAANLLLNNRLVRDELTGLVSRYQYKQEIELLIRKFPTDCGIFAFLDIDNFKQINDTFGHAAGDRYLAEFAERLKSIPFDDMICIRISGDEFGLFHQGISLPDIDTAIVDLWNQITKHVLGKSVIIDDKAIALEASVGMAIYNLDTTNIFDLVDYADFAMYMAKKSGKNRYVRFDIVNYKQIKDKNV
jgi:diguanylate cyclase (GGDEF)-like protein